MQRNMDKSGVPAAVSNVECQMGEAAMTGGHLEEGEDSEPENTKIGW
jgi:hypothetical protein